MRNWAISSLSLALALGAVSCGEAESTGTLPETDAAGRAPVPALAPTIRAAIEPVNRPPTAATVDEIEVLAGTTIELNGDGSTDPEGDALSYLWRLDVRPPGSHAELARSDSSRSPLTLDTVGSYTVSLVVSDGKSSSPPTYVSLRARPWFTNVTEEANVPGGRPQDYIDGMGPGASWGDYDQDGDLDLYVTSYGPNMLYRSNGDGTFDEVATSAGVAAACNSYGSAWGDYDEDGDLDLYVVCHSGDDFAELHLEAVEPNLLYRNNGDGTFTDVGAEAGVDHVAHGTGASWVDYDMDGDLDLHVANWGIGDTGRGRVDWGRGEGHLLYRNDGDGGFTDVTERAGVRGKVDRVDLGALSVPVPGGLSFMGLWSDLDNDGDPDLLECNEHGVSPLYWNNGDGTFTEDTERAGLFRRGDCMGVDSGDYDRDGSLDIYWTNFHENYLWHSVGDGTFEEVALRAGVADVMVGWGTGFVDFDNDGLLDIYGVNGLIGPPVEETGQPWDMPLKEPNFLYLNNGDGTFSDVTGLAGFGDTGVGRGVAVGDYDDDGDVDLYVVNADGPNILYRNDIGDLNNWLKLRFEGKQSNEFGVGVRVQLATEEWWGVAEVRSGSSYLAGSHPECIFGLGQIASVKEITVVWPSGAVQSLRDVPVNRTITITEPGEHEPSEITRQDRRSRD